MLNELHTSLLLPSELNTTAERISAIVTAAFQEDPFVQKICALIKTSIDNMEQALSKDRSSEYTKLLIEKDEARDASFTALRDFAKACSNRSKPDLAEAGQYLVDLIKKHGWTLYSKGYTHESAAMKMLFNDLNEGIAADALKTIDAELWYTELKDAQAAFEDTYNNKVSAEAIEDYPLIREAKSKLSKHFSILLGNINLLIELDESGSIEKTAEQINEIITDVMTTARARQTRKESKKNKE